MTVLIKLFCTQWRRAVGSNSPHAGINSMEQCSAKLDGTQEFAFTESL